MFRNNEVEYKGMPLLFDHQNIMLSYLHPENPYRSLIVLYKLGSGKTYAACCLTQLYLMEGFDVLYLSNSVNAVINFMNEYKSMLFDLRFKDYSKRINCITFTKFYKSKETREYGLIIMDEVHNLREIGLRYLVILGKLEKADNSKILLMTATPVVDNPKEIESIIKLTGEKDPKILRECNRPNPKLSIEYVGVEVFNETLYLTQLKGKQLEEYLKCNNKDVFTKARQASLSCSDKYEADIPLSEQSCKIDKLLKSLVEGELTVIFCFYIERGIKVLEQVLESIGYTKFRRKPGKKVYAVISGDITTDEVDEIMKNFNKIDNMDGLSISILIGSSVMKESLTLFRVKALHILTPFWNYSQIKQAIGRTIRYNSHVGLPDPALRIYLHASYVKDYTDPEDSIDMKMWYISTQKKTSIKLELDNYKTSEIPNSALFSFPEPDNRLVFRDNDLIWDFSECFDHNKFKISWCNVYTEKAVKYDLINKTVQRTNVSPYFTIHTPKSDGYTVWRSAVDNKLRLTYMDGKLGKYSKRGKLISNVKTKDIEKELQTSNLKEYLLAQNRWFDKQIEYVL